MNLVLPTASLIIGALLFTVSFHMVSRANPDERIPQFWGRPTHHPRRIYAVRAASMVLLLFGGVAWSESLGYANLFLLLLALIPAGVMNILHNRRVARGQRDYQHDDSAEQAV